MSMENNLKYYEFEGDIMFWINENWHLLQVEEVRLKQKISQSTTK